MKKALVYNRYLQTAGGGERASLDLCLALTRLEFEITIVTASSFTSSLDSLCRVFGIPTHQSWRLEKIDEEKDIARFCVEQEFDLFVNGTFCSSLANPAPLGLYSLMFPQHITPCDRKNLETYQRVFCISEFSQIYTHHWWGVDFPAVVLPLPISDSHMKAQGIDFSRKEKLILNVGRFNVDGHSKRQLDVIHTFNHLVTQGSLDKDWRLYCVGNLNAGEQNRQYLDQCRYEAGPNVHIETDVSFHRLQSLYLRASALWQFTGVHLGFGVTPQHCEHLGLVAMDGMCFGTIPMVYERSGVAYIIDHSKSGFIFGSRDELGAIMRTFDSAFGGEVHRDLFMGARKSAEKLGFENFVSNLDEMIIGAAA